MLLIFSTIQLRMQPGERQMTLSLIQQRRNKCLIITHIKIGEELFFFFFDNYFLLSCCHGLSSRCIVRSGNCRRLCRCSWVQNNTVLGSSGVILRSRTFMRIIHQERERVMALHLTGIGRYRAWFNNGGRISLLHIACVIQPIQALSIFQQGLNITSIVVPGGRVLGIHPAWVDYLINSHRTGGTGTLRLSRNLDGIRSQGIIDVLRSWDRRSGCSGGRSEETENCIFQSSHGQSIMSSRIDQLIPSRSLRHISS
mmetsp:Transcript_25207/g.40899  ORF Transcript_25207/g.40899 Transcript_25207/m.40899 type:complete len:255 (-) Transcript_25207:1692-2456(-)